MMTTPHVTEYYLADEDKILNRVRGFLENYVDQKDKIGELTINLEQIDGAWRLTMSATFKERKNG